jgi:hypothetical protein
VLFAKGVEFRRTHDLFELAESVEQVGIALPFSADDLGQLNPYAVEFRYGDPIMPTLTREEADHIAGQTLRWAETLILQNAP